MNFKKLAIRVGIPSAIILLLVGWLVVRSAGPDVEYTTFTVRRGPLDIKVLEGGNLEARESQDVKSRVRGYPGSKILTIVEEGTYITEEDVAKVKFDGECAVHHGNRREVQRAQRDRVEWPTEQVELHVDRFIDRCTHVVQVALVRERSPKLRRGLCAQQRRTQQRPDTDNTSHIVLLRSPRPPRDLDAPPVIRITVTGWQHPMNVRSVERRVQ